MDSILVQDVCEVYLKDLSNGTQYFFGITTKNDITQKVKQDMLKGGIGAGIVGVVQSEKEITFKVSTLLHNDSLYELQSGVAFTNGSTVTVQKNEVLKCTSGKLTMVGTPKGSTVVVFDSKGKVVTGTYATGAVTLTGGVEGDFYTVVYPCDVTGNVLTLDSKKFPKSYYVELHTIAYDVNTSQVVADVFWSFNKALPNGGLQAQYEAGKNNGDDIEFTAQLLQGTSEYGKYIVVPRS